MIKLKLGGQLNFPNKQSFALRPWGKEVYGLDYNGGLPATVLIDIEEK